MSDFEEYKKIGEPGKRKKAENWGVAIGLQQVDGLTPSKKLIKIAKDNIEGKISVEDAEAQISSYYKQNPPKTTAEEKKREADEVSSRINKLLSKNAFTFSPAEYVAIHKYLFTGILDEETAGKIRSYDITKAEPILNGETVHYGSAENLRETLDYDFAQEKSFSYKGLSKAEAVEHIAKLVSGIWQIHPFAEGNTRTTAVFLIKYLRTLGFPADNELFEEHALYFRNALVRANYQNLEKDVHYTPEYLHRFFDNLLLGKKNALRNSDMQVSERAKGSKKSSKKSSEKILEVIKEKPAITVQEMADAVGLSIAGVRKNLDKLRDAGALRRVGADKGGHWEIRANKGVKAAKSKGKQ